MLKVSNIKAHDRAGHWGCLFLQIILFVLGVGLANCAAVTMCLKGYSPHRFNHHSPAKRKKIQGIPSGNQTQWTPNFYGFPSHRAVGRCHNDTPGCSGVPEDRALARWLGPVPGPADAGACGQPGGRQDVARRWAPTFIERPWYAMVMDMSGICQGGWVQFWFHHGRSFTRRLPRSVDS